MSRLARKNLIVDPTRIGQLARRRKTSESAAVREAVDFALAANEVMDAIAKLHGAGGIDDVLGRLPGRRRRK